MFKEMGGEGWRRKEIAGWGRSRKRTVERTGKRRERGKSAKGRKEEDEEKAIEGGRVRGKPGEEEEGGMAQ